MYHINIYKFKCELLAAAVFNPGVMPFISNFFIFEPDNLSIGDKANVALKFQLRSLKYRLKVAEFPKHFYGRSF
jgi:hypothetical protein